MKVTKRQLKRIIREEKRRLRREACGDAGLEMPMEPIEPVEPLEQEAPMLEMPCPHATADSLRDAGASDAEVLEWVSTLLSSFQSDSMFSFTGDVGELGGDEAFGVGYEAGSRGL